MASAPDQIDAPTKRQRQRADTRQRIADAAVAAFCEDGFAGASTRDIAARAGTNQGLITYHFQSKEALWRAAADQVFGHARRHLGERLVEVEAIPDPRARARAFVREYVRYVAVHPEIFRLLSDEGKRRDERMAWLVDQHLRPMFEVFERFAVHFETGGEPLEAMHRPHAFYAMAGAGSLLFCVVPECERLTGLDPTTEEAIERHADLVARMLVP